MRDTDRINARARQVLGENIEEYESDAVMLNWAKRLKQEIECQNSVYYYLFMDCGQWVTVDEEYLYQRMNDMEMEDEISDIDGMIEYLQIDQPSQELFVFASETPITFIEGGEYEYMQTKEINIQHKFGVENDKWLKEVAILETTLEGNILNHKDVRKITELAKKILAKKEDSVW